MTHNANKILAISLLALLAGCSSTPSPMGFANHFGSAAEDEKHRKCMSENNMFNNRQLMVAPMAVENSWTYCVKKSDVWYPGKEKGDKVSAEWAPVNFNDE